MVEKNAPDVNIKIVIKDKSEWNEFIDAVCRSYGFEQKSCPIVYTLEGTLIGTGVQFLEHIKEKYNLTMQTLTKESLKSRQQLNIDENDERMRLKHKGQTLGERIHEKIMKK